MTARHFKITRKSLRLTPLPEPNTKADKNARGSLLVVGGARQVPGSMVLAATAALRAGAGKLQLATVSDIAPLLGIAVPESLVVSLPASGSGEISGSRSVAALRSFVEKADAVLIGPGMMNERAAVALVAGIARSIGPETILILDAAAVAAVSQSPEVFEALRDRVVITPHAGEMASLLGVEPQGVNSDPAATAVSAAKRFQCLVVLKGPTTWIANADGSLSVYRGNTPGLATSGSGDALAGCMAGLAARGCSALDAARWGVFLHGEAGKTLAKKIGKTGFLARELLAELPSLMD